MVPNFSWKFPDKLDLHSSQVDLLRRSTKKVVFSTKEPMFIKEAVTGIIGTLMSFATINYMLREAKSDPNSMEMKPKVYESNITFQDFYGGDIIKTKLR